MSHIKEAFLNNIPAWKREEPPENFDDQTTPDVLTDEQMDEMAERYAEEITCKAEFLADCEQDR